MSRQYLIMYSEELKETITVTFEHNAVLDRASNNLQAIFFSGSRTVYCSTSRWEELKQCDTIAMKREFFQNRVWQYDPLALIAPEEVKQLFLES